MQDFAADKARQIEADAPKTENTSLTGWVSPLPPSFRSIFRFIDLSSSSARHVMLTLQGSWGGKGVKKRKTNPKFLVKTAGIEPSKRKDFESSNVIITEKKDKRAAQFQVKDLPYPYTSVEQYEARFKTPVGSEWNSRAMHQKETMPRVTKKVSPGPHVHLNEAGIIADPIAWSYYRTNPKAILSGSLHYHIKFYYILFCCCTVSIMHTHIPVSS